MAAFYIIVMPAFFIWAGFAFDHVLRASKRAVVTTGNVTGKSWRWSARGRMCLDVLFKDELGQEHLCRSSYCDMFHVLEVGSVVEVGYDPKDIKNCDLTAKNLSVAERAGRNASYILMGLFWLAMMRPIIKHLAG